MVAGDPDVINDVVTPVSAYVADLSNNVVATTEVALDGVRANIRTRETNLGNLIADAFLWQGQALAADFGVDSPQVALGNGGGIRNDSVIPAGNLTELDTFSILPFGNFLTVVPDVPVTQFKAILENAVSRVEARSGRFAQIAGFQFTWDGADDGGQAIPEGMRVQTVELVDSSGNVTQTLVTGGNIVDTTVTIDIAIVDFLARGGDDYPFNEGQAFTNLGVSYQQALSNFITGAAVDGGLGGTVSTADYPEAGSGRITVIDPPPS